MKVTETVLRSMVAEGMSDGAIGAEIGVTSRTVLRWRTALGIASCWRPELAPCGDYASYARGCRCRPCTAANTEYCRRYKRAKPRTIRRAEAAL